MDYEPISVALKFGFLAVLYLFLLWIARSARKDLRQTVAPAPDATGFHALPSYDDAASGEDAWLVVQRGGGLREGERFDLFGGLSIGRSKSVECVLSDPNVSRRHAELRRGDNGDWQIVDLGSTNGIKVNGRRVPSTRLSPGDQVTVGTTTFSFDIEQ